MGTRGIIAKPEGDGWAGRYHHWDSYPSGLGATLLELHAGHFGGDVAEMVRYLVDDEPVGWSTINGADWSLPKGWHDRHDPNGTCGECGAEMWRHYAQYYPEGGPSDPMVNGARRAGLLKPGKVMQLGHTFAYVDAPTGPQSYSARGEEPLAPEGDWLRSIDDHDSGCEWVYVLTPSGVMVFDGDRGAFGCGGGNFSRPVLVPWGDLAGMLALGASDD